MKKIKTSYGTIISFALIISTILMPLSFLPKTAEAQLNISGYTRGLAPAIAKLPQCEGTALGAIKGLFNGIFGSGETGGDIDNLPIRDIPLTSMESLKSTKAINPVDSVPKPSLDETSNSLTIKASSTSSSAETNRLLKLQLDEQKKLGKTAEKINEQSSCIASIGRLITKMLLQKLTLSTVNWINSGYDGSPSFVQDPGKFFKAIADNEILQFGIEINGISPFSKNWMRNNALAVQRKFADNARYSLNELIQQTNPEYSAETFSQNFSAGGWDAWTALTQVPANNPLGFKLLADNEIQKRLEGVSQSVARNTRDALQAANGFLGDQRCADPKGVTKEEDYKALRVLRKIDSNGNSVPDNPNDPNANARVCKRWEYVTPGKLISEAATTAINYQNNSLLNVEDLNDAVAAISDAILNQFSTSIYEKGFANLDYQGIDGVLVFSGANTEKYKSQTQKDYMPSQLSSSWLQANPEFNIRTDLTQALIDEQRTYSDKLALQNKELMSTIDGKDYVMGADGKSNAYGLMPAIYQLDYCIPGPHPGWEDDSRETLGTKLNSFTPAEEKPPNVAGEIANGAIGVGLNFVPYVGPLLSGVFGMLTGDTEIINRDTNARASNTNEFAKLTGYRPQALRKIADEPKDTNMLTKEGLFYVLNTVLDRYINIMNKTYFSSPDILPPIANEAKKEFEQLPGYNQIIKDNRNKMFEVKTTVSILGEIKDKVDSLNAQLEAGIDLKGNPFTETDYEEALKFQINAFGRLSASMVNGDDIANANDLAQQIVLKKNYIYKNLLKGPYGCEAFLGNQANIKQFPSAGSGVKQANYDWDKYNVNSIKRMTYPFPIIYDYSNFAKGELLPDPWNSGYTNTELPKMPAKDDYDNYNKYGPGFLNFVHFSAIYDCDKPKPRPQPGETCDSSPRTNTYNGSERLNLSGLVNDFAPGYQDETRVFHNVSVGEIGPEGGGPFEKTIGIY